VRRFILRRSHDVSGISGTGDVAEGVQFSDGTVTIRWTTHPRSHVVWDSIADAEHVHGHGGATRVHWLDGPSLNAA